MHCLGVLEACFEFSWDAAALGKDQWPKKRRRKDNVEENPFEIYGS